MGLKVLKFYSLLKRRQKAGILSSVVSFMLTANGPFAAAGWEFRDRKLGKSTKDY